MNRYLDGRGSPVAEPGSGWLQKEISGGTLTISRANASSRTRALGLPRSIRIKFFLLRTIGWGQMRSSSRYRQKDAGDPGVISVTGTDFYGLGIIGAIPRNDHRAKS